MYFVKNEIEMIVAGGIVAFSIPFAAGVVVAALLPPGEEGSTYWWVSLAGSACLGLACAVFCSKGRRSRTAYAMCFILGALAYSCARLRGAGTFRLPGLALGRFAAFIDATDFHHEQTGALLKAFLTGRRDGLDETVANSFRESGASHLLALSGLHLGIVYGILAKMLALLGHSRTATLVRSLTAISAASAFTLLTGASPSTIRAFLFILLNEISRLQPGRHRSAINIYCTALTIQLAAYPLAIDSLGFQLSYLAMLGIYLLFPKMNAWYPGGSRFNPLRYIWTSMAMSISCQVFTAPLVWLRFHSFPLFFLLTNLLALPLTSAMMLCGLAALALSAAGCCPDIMKSLTDAIGQALIFCLETISTLRPIS